MGIGLARSSKNDQYAGPIGISLLRNGNIAGPGSVWTGPARICAIVPSLYVPVFTDGFGRVRSNFLDRSVHCLGTTAGEPMDMVDFGQAAAEDGVGERRRGRS